MSEIILRLPVPFSSKHVFMALEEDRDDHKDHILSVDGVSYGLISQRTEEHPDYQTRGPDAFEAVYRALPQLAEIEVGVLRDSPTASIVF